MSRVFLDTNIWLYSMMNSKDEKEAQKKDISKKLIKDCDDIYVSLQVVNEILIWLHFMVQRYISKNT